MTGSTYEDKKKSQNDGRRRTPKDVHYEKDIRAPAVVTEKPKSREATKKEVSANNRCSYEAARELFDVRSRLETFRTSVPANHGRGRSELFSEMMILYGIEVMGFLNIDYRKAAGIVAALLEQHGLCFPSYSRFYERVARAVDDMVLGAPVTDGRILCRFVMVDKTGRKRRLIIDSTGLTLTNITIWRKTKWKNGPKYRGWLKLHALTDLDTNEIVTFVLTKDDTGDEDMLEYLLEMADRAAWTTMWSMPTGPTPPCTTSNWSAGTVNAGSSRASSPTPGPRTSAASTEARLRGSGASSHTENGPSRPATTCVGRSNPRSRTSRG